MKKRLDVLLFEKGLAESRTVANSFIMQGKVYVNGEKADKPGMRYDENADISVKNDSLQFVSRGGLKLDKAIKVFGINLNNLIALDAGASTGGFTDCMIQNGCKKVYAVDVGYGQLAWKLRNDKRIVNIERTNIRYIKKEAIQDKIDFFTADLSFISLCTVLPVIRNIVSEDCEGVCLIKPQFEAGKDKVGKNGVVKDGNVIIETIEKVVNFCLNNGFSVKGLDFSPIKGAKGNIEYLVYLKKSEKTEMIDDLSVSNVYKNSVKEL